MRHVWNALIAEGAGTFLFFFVGIGSAAMVDWSAVVGQELPGLLVVALAHGLVLAVLVSSLGAVSGAHFNPAVTFGVWVAGQIGGRKAIAYVVAQLVGGVMAAFVLRTVFSSAVSPRLGTPILGPGIESSGGLAIEAVLTVVLLLAVFGTAIDPRGPKVGGLAIGLALGADILMGGPLTGAAMNPARWFAPALVSGTWDNAPVWIIGPLVGAAIAARAYRLFFLPESHPGRSPATPAGE
jgi:MIP family channel proteins